MNKLFVLVLISLLPLGCAVHITPEKVYLEPLSDTIVIGLPIVVAPPAGFVVRPLPPVIFHPGRHLYYHSGIYYYHFRGGWYYGKHKHKKGPWYKLPKKYYPTRYKRPQKYR